MVRQKKVTKKVRSRLRRVAPLLSALIVVSLMSMSAVAGYMSANLLSSGNGRILLASSGSNSSDDADEDEEEDDEEDEDEADENEDEDTDDDADTDDDEEDEDTADEQEDGASGVRTITSDQARTIALNSVGTLPIASTDRVKVEYKEDDNVYEVKIKNGIVEIEIEIDAVTGEIVKSKREIENEDADEAGPDLDALVTAFPANQQKVLKKLLRSVDDADQQALVDFVLTLEEGVRAALLGDNSGHGNNQLYKHAQRVLKKEGLAAFQAFLEGENDIRSVLVTAEQARVDGIADTELQKLLKRAENFNFPASMSDEAQAKIQAVVEKLQSGALTREGVREFEAALHDLIQEAKRLKVTNGDIPFVDVDDSPDESVSSDFVEDIAFLKESGITNGFEDGTFRGEKEITRAEYMAMILRAKYGVVGTRQKLASVDLDVLPSDVPRNSSLASVIALAYEDGITKAEDEFGFARPVTRGEAMVIAARAFGVEVPATVQAHFSDTTNLESEFKRVINKAGADGVISGSNGKFNPGRPIRRDEAGKVIHRAVLLWLTENPL